MEYIIESPDINCYIYDQLLFNKGSKIIQWVKIVFSAADPGTSEYSHVKYEI